MSLAEQRDWVRSRMMPTEVLPHTLHSNQLICTRNYVNCTRNYVKIDGFEPETM